MGNVELDVQFSPQRLKAFSRNEVKMDITIKNLTQSVFWGECEIRVASPLSLAHDSEMNAVRARIGILKPGASATRPVKLFTRPNNYPDEYGFTLVAYLYDEDAAISERVEKRVSIMCSQEESTRPVQDKK